MVNVGDYGLLFGGIDAIGEWRFAKNGESVIFTASR